MADTTKSGVDTVHMDSLQKAETQATTDTFDAVLPEAIGGQSTADLPPKYYRSYKFIGSYISFALSYQAALLGYLFPANVVTIINADIGPSESYIWVLLVFILCQSATCTIVGRLSDIFGRRWYYIGGSALAFIGSIVCSRSMTINVLIGGSAILGVGSAVQTSSSLVSGELIPNKHRFLGLGVMFGILAPIAVIAPGIAHVWVTKTEQSWRWCYYFVAILSFISLVLQLVCYFPPKFDQLHTRGSKMETVKSIDYIGLFAFAGSLASLLLGISWGGQRYRWSSYEVITTITVGLVGLIAFTLYESFAKLRFPLMPISLLKNRNYVFMLVCSSVASMIFYAVNVIWPQQIQGLFGEGASGVGWTSCTLTAGVISGEFVGAISIAFIGRIKWQLVATCVLFTSFCGGMASVTVTTRVRAEAFTTLAAFFIGYMEVITLAGCPLSVDPKDIGLASGLQVAIRTAMSSLATSIYVTILENKVATNIPKYVIPAIVAAGLPQSSVPQLLGALAADMPAELESVPGITPTILEAASTSTKFAYQKSFQLIYLVSLAFGGLSIIAALSVSEKTLKSKMTSNISRKLQGVKGVAKHDEEKTMDL